MDGLHEKLVRISFEEFRLKNPKKFTTQQQATFVDAQEPVAINRASMSLLMFANLSPSATECDISMFPTPVLLRDKAKRPFLSRTIWKLPVFHSFKSVWGSN